MNIDSHTLEDLLVLPKHITKKQFGDALEYAKKEHIPPEQALVKKGFISDENLSRTIADYLDYHFIDLRQVKVSENCLTLLPEVVARAQQTVFYGKTGTDTLKVATTNTDNYEFLKLLEKKTGKKIDVYYTTQAGIDVALKYYKGDLRKRTDELIEKCEHNQQEGDVVALVDLLLEYAYDSQASDIHIEPLEENVSIRFRVDGLLHEAATYSRTLHEKIAFRIKIMARLQTDEHGAAQDGRFNVCISHTSFDVRVSFIPVTYGENIVMRLLASHAEHLSLRDLGLQDADLQKVVKASGKPHGMILAVGPTGSGKTTTLYTILQFLNKPEVNIMTIEDPLEYDIDHVQQTQVNSKKDLTFATGLRSIVRQDPDIIMVGEIRDEETADIAINAAMTGHLLLSTLHTNDAATTFPRLIEMQIEPFLVSSSVHVIIAQRLVRKICEGCRKSYRLTTRETGMIRRSPKVFDYIKKLTGKEALSGLRLYKGAGCKLCNETGFRGRTGVFEVLEVSEVIRVLIAQKATASVINQKALEEGMTPLLFDGLFKAVSGITTLEEVMKTVHG